MSHRLARFSLALLLVMHALAPASVRAAPDSPQTDTHVVALSELPPQVRDTVRKIRRGGPFTYERDGAIFGNFERALPLRSRGYYREYTVPTPGVRNRGVRRLVAGRGGELYYTDDHYRTFRRIRE